MKEKSFKSNLIWNSIGSFTYLICQWLLTLIIIRTTNNLKYAGIFSLALSISNIFITIANFNVRPFLVSDLKQEFSVSDYTCFKIITCSISLVLCILYSLFFCYSGEQLLCILLYMVFKIGESIVELFHAFEQRKSRMDIGGISLLIRGILSIVSFSLGLIIFDNLAIAIILMAIVTYLFIFTFDYYNVKKFEKIKVVFNKKKVIKLLLTLLPLTIGSCCGIISTSFPRQVLEKINGADILGIYATIATPAVIVQVAATYIYNPLLVDFTKLKNKKDKTGFSKLFIKGLVMILFISILCYLGSIFFSEKLLFVLYGDKIAKYHNLLDLVMIYTGLTGFMWYFYNILIIFRKIKELLIYNVIALVLCIIFSAVFINKFYMNGVTDILIVTTVVMIIGMFASILKCINNLKIKTT